MSSVDADLAHASTEEIARAVAPLIGQAERDRERPTRGRLSADGGRSCPLDGAVLAEVDATGHAVEEAARQSAQVVVARYERERLRDHGDIAALLRW